MAWAANGSGPDDPLHGIDLALEKVGIGSGGAAERLAEASELVASGATAQGLNHAANALRNETGQTANGMAAADALAEAQAADPASPVPEGVADLLSYLSDALRNEGVKAGR